MKFEIEYKFDVGQRVYVLYNQARYRSADLKIQCPTCGGTGDVMAEGASGKVKVNCPENSCYKGVHRLYGTHTPADYVPHGPKEIKQVIVVRGSAKKDELFYVMDSDYSRTTKRYRPTEVWGTKEEAQAAANEANAKDKERCKKKNAAQLKKWEEEHGVKARILKAT